MRTLTRSEEERGRVGAERVRVRHLEACKRGGLMKDFETLTLSWRYK